VKELFASVDLGGTKIAAAIAGGDGEILAEDRIATNSHEGSAGVLPRIAGLVADLAARLGAQPAVVGVGVPGLVDVATGVTQFLPNLPSQWRGVPVGETLSNTLRCPVFLLNDARMATLGEFTFGRGRAADTMIFLTIGTGIGGASSSTESSASAPWVQPANSVIRPSSGTVPFAVAATGCVWRLWPSGPALVGEGVRLLLSGLAPMLFEMVSGNAGAVTPKEMGAAARAGDTQVRDAIARTATWLGIGIANMVAALHPDLVVLGGSVAALDDLLLQPVRETVKARVRMFPAGDIPIERSLLGDRAGLLGGIALAATKAHETALVFPV
jgi:glucokinase